MMGRIQVRKRSKVDVPHISVTLGRAVDMRIVDQDRHAVARDVHVAFDDVRPELEGATKRGQRIFRLAPGGTAMADHARNWNLEEGMSHHQYVIIARHMAVLTRDIIVQEIAEGRLKITPLSRDQIGVASIDLTLGHEVRRIITDARPIDILEETDHVAHTEVVQLDEPYLLQPGETIHGITQERVSLPPDLCGFLEGRSRFARLGLMIHVTSALVQPGVDNCQVLEMSNVAHQPLRIHAGVRVCQLVLMRTEGAATYTGRFQHQTEV